MVESIFIFYCIGAYLSFTMAFTIARDIDMLDIFGVKMVIFFTLFSWFYVVAQINEELDYKEY